MYRVDSGVDPLDLQELAEKVGARLYWAVGRCQHGFSAYYGCRSCEGGFADDVHMFANLRSDPARLSDGRDAVAVSDDGWDVSYIPSHFQHLLDAEGA